MDGQSVSARVLSTTTNEQDLSQKDNPIIQVTQTLDQGNQLLAAESGAKTATSEKNTDNASQNTVQIIIILQNKTTSLPIKVKVTR